MSRRKIQTLVALFWLGLFVLSSYEPVFLWIMILSLVVLSPGGAKTGEDKGRKDRVYQIEKDARRYGLRMPRKALLRSLLFQIYSKFSQAKESYPHLASDYEAIIEEMWMSLSHHVDADHWESVLSKVCSQWPVTQKSSSSLDDRLNKVKELTLQWDEARREVQGGSHV